MKLYNTSNQPLGLGATAVIPAGGSVEIDDEEFERLYSKSKVVKHWRDNGLISDSPQRRSTQQAAPTENTEEETDDLDQMSHEELVEEAKRLEVAGASTNWNPNTLRTRIREARAAAEE